MMDHIVKREVQSKVAKIQKEREDLQKAAENVKELLQQKTDAVDKLFKEREKLKNKLKAQEKENERVEGLLDKKTIEYNKTVKKLLFADNRCSEVMEMFDNCNDQLEAVRSEMAKLVSKNDPQYLDQIQKKLQRYVTWASQMMQVSIKLSQVFEKHWTCGLCGCLAETPIIADPCGHVFCYDCLENQGYHANCRVCREPKESTHRCPPVMEFVPEYEEAMNAFQKVRKSFSTEVQADPTERIKQAYEKQKTAMEKKESDRISELARIAAFESAQSQSDEKVSDGNNSETSTDGEPQPTVGGPLSVIVEV